MTLALTSDVYFYQMRGKIDRLMVLAALSEAGVSIVRLYWIAFLFYIYQSFGLRKIRRMIERCQGNCTNPDGQQSCLADFYKDAKRLRDHMIIMRQKCAEHRFGIPLAKMTDYAISDWDDFTTILAVASDSEFRDLVGKVAHAV